MDTQMIGIYQLNFSSGDTYIGKSTCIERRISHHKSSKGLGSPKLQKAYSDYAYLGHTVLEECTIEELGERETFHIFNLNPTLNILPGGEGVSGLNHPRSKYTEKEIRHVVDLYANSFKTHKEISDETGVSYSTVQDIIKGRSHQWATKHLNLVEIEDERIIVDQVVLYDISNNKYVVNKGEFSKFEKEHGYSSGTIKSLLKSSTGKSLYKGLSLYPFKLDRYLLKDPDGITIECTLDEAKRVLSFYDLNAYNMKQILEKGKESVGWRLSLIESPTKLEQN